MVGILVYFGFVISAYNSIFQELSKGTWNAKNQIISEEVYSPDSTKKVGFYYYDAGNYGYTTVCVSIVKSNEKYPIEPNVLKEADWAVDSVVWRNNHDVSLQVEPGYSSSKKPGSVPSSFNLDDVRISFEPVK